MMPATTSSSSFSLVLGWGLRIASQIPIPGAIAASGLDPDPDVTVSLGNCRDSQRWPELYRWDGSILDFAPPGVALFRITRDTIIIHPDPAASEEAICGLLIATAIPALLWLKGMFVLHAAGLVLTPDGHSVAIAGPSGVGKSTLALWFIQQGAELLGDDTLAIDLIENTAFCRGLSGGVFQGTPDMRHFKAVSPKPSGNGSAIRIGAIIVLARGQDLAIRPLHSIEAFLTVMQNRHRPKVPLLVGRQQATMDMASALCRTIPIYELRFDKQKHRLQELGALISNLSEKDWLADDAIPTE